MYDYILSSGDLMQMILPNVDAIQKMTESEFIEWLRLAFAQKVDEVFAFEFATLDFEVSDKINGSEDIT